MRAVTSEKFRKFRRVVLGAALVVPVVLIPTPAPAQEKASTQSLYQRVGGYDVIAKVVDDFLNQLGADPTFKRFGQGRSMDSLGRSRQLIVDQICNLSGGPCLYIGREMKPSHAGLAITDAEWEASNKMLQASLQKFKVSEPDQKEFLAVIEKLRPDIVEPPKAKPAEPKG